MSKTVAFIPVRGGSKSIPLKNIKDFCGKPLVYWSIKALEDTPEIDQIIIATDAPEIEEVVKNFNFLKTEIYKRAEENAQDTSSTESVMIEYLSQSSLDKDDVFILVQATSPLTQSNDFSEGLSMFHQSNVDSVLSGVRFKRFFWNTDGTPQNYDYKNRPRRQDFPGELMENGAFYINTVQRILNEKNRLGGRIGFYEMSEYTAFEIDEPDDWTIAEQLMKRYILQSQNTTIPKKIKLFLTDIDGVWTDGGMYYDQTGNELKKFNTSDAIGVSFCKKLNIPVGIITGENTEIVQRRAEKIKIDFLYQGITDKLSVAKEICEKLQISLSEVAYIGDDVGDLSLLENVGFSAAPHNAKPYIKSKVQFVTQLSGGDGAFREFVEQIIGIDAIEKILTDYAD